MNQKTIGLVLKIGLSLVAWLILWSILDLILYLKGS